ncbi:response regulator [Devosia sp. 1566]|uniref:response regulator n=1 Tax=Devosia sp. 1566 TaxID=2499144 RepID=UPI000FD6C99C|nr:response regulator [Devosia sp. 1566]
MNTTIAEPCRKAFLIVDDEPLVRLELGDIVRDCGLDAWEAANTAEALAMLEADASKVIGLITDINMPGTRSGIVLANHVGCIWPHINIIVVSAVRRPLPGELPFLAKYLAKPVPATKLVSTIHELVPH